MALLLSIDTSTNHASVALSQDKEILALKTCSEQKEHASFLQPAIEELFKETGSSKQTVAAVAVTTGPGSYTGLRVGLASAKGLCYAWNIPLIAAGTLEVMAYAGKQFMDQYHPFITNYFLCPMIDARRNEVFTAVFDQHLNCLQQPFAHILQSTSFEQELTQQPVLFFGSGAAKWEAMSQHSNARFETVTWHAATLAAIAHTSFQQQVFASLAYTSPLYVKEFYSPAGEKK